MVLPQAVPLGASSQELGLRATDVKVPNLGDRLALEELWGLRPGFSPLVDGGRNLNAERTQK
jgi:hypothetical protein